MKSIQKVIILFPEIPKEAREDEQDAQIQVDAVMKGLINLGFEPIPVPFTLNLPDIIETLKKISPAFVFNLVESADGHGRLIHLAPALLDALKIPYTGANTDAAFLTSNKILAKKMLKGAMIDTPRWFTAKDLQEDSSFIEGRYIIKSVWEHASIGLDQDSILYTTNTQELRKKMETLQARLGGECFAEEYIEGREFNLSILASSEGPQLLPPAEIRFIAYSEEKFKILDYRAKWKPDTIEYDNTIRSFQFFAQDTPLLAALKEVAMNCWNLFELRGYARVDFRVDLNGKPFVLEVNTNPCLSSDAGFFAASKEMGLSFDEVISRIIRDSGIDQC